jgi:hypothetical protein
VACTHPSKDQSLPPATQRQGREDQRCVRNPNRKSDIVYPAAPTAFPFSSIVNFYLNKESVAKDRTATNRLQDADCGIHPAKYQMPANLFKEANFPSRVKMPSYLDTLIEIFGLHLF